jgi:hypothetical protein
MIYGNIIYPHSLCCSNISAKSFPRLSDLVSKTFNFIYHAIMVNVGQFSKDIKKKVSSNTGNLFVIYGEDTTF